MQQLVTKPIELASRGTQCPYCGGSRQVKAPDGRQVNCPQCCKSSSHRNQLITK